MRRLFLIRHAAPAKDHDVPAREWALSPAGRADAERLAGILTPFAPAMIIPGVPGAIVASDEMKAQQTAQPLADRLGMTVEVMAGLHEHERRTVGYLDDETFQATMARFFAEPDTLVFGEETASQAEAAHRAEITRHHDVAAQLDQRVAQVGQLESRLALLEQELERERRRYSDLSEARRLEGDSRHIRRLALEAFNRSEHVDRIVAISRSIGDPVVHVAVDGGDLPRAVRITVAWDISWYEYVVRLDLYEQTVSVEEDARGGDPRGLPPDRLHPNAVLRSDRVVLTMQAYGVGAASA